MTWTSFSLALLMLVTTSCKPRSSSLSSLSKDELAKCGVFNGKRLYFLVNPANEFDGDVDAGNEIFLKQVTDNNRFTQFSYFTDRDGKISEACEFYVNSQQAKYEVGVPALTGNNATRETLRTSLEALGRRIAAIREEAIRSVAPENRDTYQVQVVIAISSHGDEINEAHPDGTIVLNSPRGDARARSQATGEPSSVNMDYMTYTDFSQLLAKNILTTCDGKSGAACQADPLKRRADELMILMDNCFSGHLQAALKEMFRSLLGYNQLLSLKSGSKATRVFSLTSAQSNLVAAGSYLDSGHGALFELIALTLNFWMADANHDNTITISELKNFVSDPTTPGSYSKAVISLSLRLVKVLTNRAERGKFVADLRTRRSSYEKLFANPIDTLKKVSFLEGRIGIQQPTFLSNVDQETLETLLFAVRGASAFDGDPALDPEVLKVSNEASMMAIKELVSILQKISTYAEKNPNAPDRLDIAALDLGPERHITEYLLSVYGDQKPGPSGSPGDPTPNPKPNGPGNPGEGPSGGEATVKKMFIADQGITVGKSPVVIANKTVIVNLSSPGKTQCELAQSDLKSTKNVALAQGQRVNILGGFILKSMEGPTFISYALENNLALTCAGVDTEDEINNVIAAGVFHLD